jgi:superfamily II RNA helicase
MFEELKPEEIAAVLSCLVCESKSDFNWECIKEENLLKVYEWIKKYFLILMCNILNHILKQFNFRVFT